jgi:transposase-like protein
LEGNESLICLSEKRLTPLIAPISDLDSSRTILTIEPVEVCEMVQCPYCGQSFELALDTSVATQRFTTDCEVCCRPFEVFAECEPGEVLSLQITGG